MQIFDTIGSYFINTAGAAESTESTSVSTETMSSTVSTGGDGFTTMLSLLAVTSSDTQAQTDDVVTGIQSAFMSSLGVADGAEDAMSLLASDEGLAKLQGTFLAVLKADLLKSAVSASADSDTAVVAEEAVEAVVGEEESGSDWDAFMDRAFGDDGVDWNDGFDAVNLLHHIPLVSDFYQNVSSSHISAASDLAGSLLYGGPAGLAYSAVNLGVKEMTGDSITNHLWSAGHNWFFSEDTTGTKESITEAAIGEQGEAAAQSAYQFARRKFVAD